MPSVSCSLEVSVDERLSKYIRVTNAKKKTELKSRTDGIDDLLTKAGF